MAEEKKRTVSRRDFVRKTAMGAVGIGVTAMSASSYSRVKGANDRLQIGIIGPGRRGHDLLNQLGRLKDNQNVEVSSVCDLWSYYRDMGAGTVNKLFGKAPKKYQYYEQMLGDKELDGVIVSTGDFQHALILVDVLKAGKDCYCEKPMSTDLGEAKQALETWKKSKCVVQIGTQRRSEARHHAVRDLVRSGELGKISKIEVNENYNGPRWHNDRPDVWAALREEDTDWRRWLLNKPYRPFNKGEYLEYRIHKELSSGIPDQWMSHIIDIIQFTMDEDFPRSAVTHGGIFVWKEARQSPDTFLGVFEFPKGFLASYSCNFGNEYPNRFLIFGSNGTINLEGQDWTISGAGGQFRHKENTDQIKSERVIEAKEEFEVGTVERSSVSQPWPGHMKNWVECIRTRKQPNATVWNGYCMTVAVLMSVMALDEGRKKFWDPIRHEIIDTPPSV